MNNTSELYSLIDFYIESSESGKKIDIRSLFDVFVVYESIDKYFMTGTLVMNMPLKWLLDNRIEEGDKVYIEFKNKDAKRNFSFNIVKKEPTEQSKDMINKNYSFMIFMVDSYLYLLNRLLFQGRYKGSPESIIESTIKSRNVDLKIKNKERTVAKIDFIGINYRIYDFLKMICKYSISANTNNHGYLFYQNMDGFNFVTYDYLRSQSSVLATIEYANSGYDIAKHTTDYTFMHGGFSFDEEADPANNIGVCNHAYNNRCIVNDLGNSFENVQYSVYDREIYNINDNKYTDYIKRSMSNVRRVLDIKNDKKFVITDMAGDIGRTSGRIVDVKAPNIDPMKCMISKVKHVFKSSILYRSDYKLIIIE